MCCTAPKAPLRLAKRPASPGCSLAQRLRALVCKGGCLKGPRPNGVWLGRGHPPQRACTGVTRRSRALNADAGAKVRLSVGACANANMHTCAPTKTGGLSKTITLQSLRHLLRKCHLPLHKGGFCSKACHPLATEWLLTTRQGQILRLRRCTASLILPCRFAARRKRVPASPLPNQTPFGRGPHLRSAQDDSTL